MTLFHAKELTDGLRQLVSKLQQQPGRTSVRIVGGAALALRHFDRTATRDIDAAIDTNTSKFDDAVAEVANENGWSNDWLNREAAKYIPSWGKRIEWETIFDDGKTVIEVAPAEAMLAMKLRANRPGRDDTDIAKLMAVCGIDQIEHLDDLYGDYYPGDALDDRAIKIIEHILAVGIPNIPEAPRRPEI